MNITVEYIDHIGVECRKMRTTRGPGYTTLKVSLKAAVPESEMPPSPWPSLTAACDAAVMPEAMADLKADRLGLTWGYWYTDAKEQVFSAFSFFITFEDRGHAKRAEAARGVLKRLRSAQVEAEYLRQMIVQAVEAAKVARSREEDQRNLAWMASGIYAEALREAKAAIHYDNQLASLRRALSNHTENFAIDMVAAIAREHGADEAALKQAVEAELTKPHYYIGHIG